MSLTGTWRKAALIGLALAALAPPLNRPFEILILIAVIFLAVCGEVRAERRRWLGAVLLVGALLATMRLLPDPRIEEGQNIFLIDGPDPPLSRVLPADVYAVMAGEFDAAFPPSGRCDPATPGCWRKVRLPAEAYAPTADGLLQRPLYSRQVRQIDFDDAMWARVGVVNEARYGWYGPAPDPQRMLFDERAPRATRGLRTTIPFYLLYRFPADFAGGQLCWRGELLWETADGRFDRREHDQLACADLDADAVGRRIFALSIRPAAPLQVSLQAPAAVRGVQALRDGLAIAGIVGLLALLLRLDIRRLALPALWLGLGVAGVALVAEPAFLQGFRGFAGGDDGVSHEGFGRLIARAATAGDWSAALAGGEPVFYFMPGLRYVRALENLIFGDTNYLYLAVMVAWPGLVFAAARTILPLGWAAAAAVLLNLPFGRHVEGSFVELLTPALQGYPDAMGFAALLAGFVALFAGGPVLPAGRALGGALLAALAIALRPNLLPAVVAMMAMLPLWRGRGLAAIAALLAGLAPLALIPLHNWAYGHRLILFTSSVDTAFTLPTPPAVYGRAFGELLRGETDGVELGRVGEQLAAWLSGSGSAGHHLVVNAILLLPLVVAALLPRADRPLRALASMALAQHAVLLFFHPFYRYAALAWLLTWLVDLALLHRGLAVVTTRRRGDRPAEEPWPRW